MPEKAPANLRRDAAIGLLRHLRRLDEAIGVKHSGIARDVGLLLYEGGERGLSVNQISSKTGYSGPTVRLVLERLTESKSLALAGRIGKTQFYRLTPKGIAGFDGYVAAIWAFAAERGAQAAISAAGTPATAPDPPAGPTLPPGRYAALRPDRPAAE